MRRTTQRMPVVRDVQRNGPTTSERPYASVVALVGPLPRQRTPLQRLSRPPVRNSTLRGGFQVWQKAYVVRTSHSMLPLGE